MTWIKSKVVMLPTNQKSKLSFSKTRKDRLCLINRVKSIKETGQKEELVDACPEFQLPISEVSFHHLYFISDEEIKGGDWFVDLYKGHILKASKDFWCGPQDFAKKIISTTDKSLKIVIPRHNDFDSEYQLPEPPKEFLETYVKAYNEGRMIEEVFVEYELQASCYPKTTEWCLKINPDNTITTKKVKDYWTRGEVDYILRDAFDSVCGRAGYDDLIDEWIEKNL